MVLAQSMKLRSVLNDDEILALSRLADTGAGAALLKLLDAEVEKERDTLEESPAVSDDGKKDFRYRLGVIAGLRRAKRASQDAKTAVIKSEEIKP